MRTIVLLILLHATCIVGAQDTLSTGEIFDFEIGDEFQTRQLVQVFGNSVYGVLRRTVIDKFYSATGDTVFYEFFRDDYSVSSSMSNPQGTYSFGTGTFISSYTNLDSLYEPMGYSDTLTTEWGPYPNPIDYIFYENSDLCDVPAVRFEIRDHNLDWLFYYYGKGLGQIGFGQGNYHSDMFYYKKGEFECGERDTLSIEDSVKELSQRTIRVYPNPLIGNHIYLDLNEDSSTSYSIFSLNGTLIQMGKVESNTITFQNLEAGAYILKLNNDQRSFTPIRLLKLNS